MPDSCIVSLPIDPPAIPERLREIAHEAGLVEKPEFHISVIVTRNAREVRAGVSASPQPAMLEESIRALVNSRSWEYAPTGAYFFQEKSFAGKVDDEGAHTPPHTRRTIIELMTLPDMEPFYQALMGALGIELGIPVPHTTLFSWSDYSPRMTQGIGICSQKDFEEYSRGRIVL